MADVYEEFWARYGVKPLEPGADAHRQTASQMFGVPYDEVTDAQRKAAKVVNFPSLYNDLPPREKP